MTPRRSLAGPVILLVLGGLFLWNNLRPDVPLWDLAAKWWPFLLILWGLVRLAEVLIWPERRACRTVGGGEIFLIVLLCIVGTAMFEGRRHGFHLPRRGMEFFGEEYQYPVSAQAPAAGIRRIVFENGRGNIRLTGGDVQEIKVTGHKIVRAFSQADADRAHRETPVELVPQGDRILVRTNQDRVPDRQRVSDDLEVTVPRQVGAEARGRYGDYEFSDITGDVEVTSDNAGVRLTRIGGNARVELRRSDIVRAVDVKGNLSLQGRGTDIELENISGQVTINGGYSGRLVFKNLAKPLHLESRNTDLHVEAVPGHIHMTLAEFNARNVSGPMRFTTKARDVRVEDFTNTLELETERGDITLLPRVPLGKISARSTSGNIEFRVPDKAAFQLQAVAEHGETVNDFGPAIQRTSDGRASSMKGKVGNGPVVQLTTNRGTVTVRKASAVKPQTLEEAKF